MSSQKIEKLLERYFQGETSLGEEKSLREFFRREDLPPHLAGLREQFILFDEEGSEELPADFDDVLFDEIDRLERSSRSTRRTYILYISGVAATVLIMVTLFFRFDPFTREADFNQREAETAFAEASKILYFVSDRFNNGAKSLGKVARFDEGMDNLKSVKKFDEGVEKATPVSKFSQITNLITNPAPDKVPNSLKP